MPYPGMNKTEVKWMDDCTTAIKGVNKKTGKPYTPGEKIAICKSQMMKSKGAEFTGIDKDIFDKIESLELKVVAQLLRNKRARNVVQAKATYEALLAKSGYDVDILESLLSK
jgi:hypothetical protein